MTDIVDPATRSRMMAGIRGSNTKPERDLRTRLHRRGFRYRLHANIPGRPDFVLPKYKAAVFVHGCFWHGHNCHLYRLPTTRRDFWKKKIAGNRIRDRRRIRELGKLGWRCLTVWECAFRGRGQLGLDETVNETERWIFSGPHGRELRGSG